MSPWDILGWILVGVAGIGITGFLLLIVIALLTAVLGRPKKKPTETHIMGGKRD